MYSFVSLYEDISWRGDNLINPMPLYLDEESFNTGKELINNNNLERNGRVSRLESQVAGEEKPSASFTYQPRCEDLQAILYSHFQMGTLLGSNPYILEFVPSKKVPTYTTNNIRPEGGYGSEPGDVYSVSFLKKYFDTTENNGTNSLFFKHGICDKFTLKLEAGDDLTLACEYRFREIVNGTAIDARPPSAVVGTYDSNKPFLWYEGTINIEGVTVPLDSIKFTCDNHIIEKMVMAYNHPESFAFKDYTVEGEFKLDFPKDGLLYMGSMFAVKSFSINGTIYKDGTNAVYFDLPYCVRMPFNVGIKENPLSATIPFRALEYNGIWPVKIRVVSDKLINGFDALVWDAGNGARNLADYGVVDAGGGVRTLSEYGVGDRDFA